MTDAIPEPKTEATPEAMPAPVADKAADISATVAHEADKHADNNTILGGELPKETQGAPEKYADFVLPENMSMNPEAIAKATAAFRDMNLSQENAQKLVTIQADYAKATESAALESLEKKVTTWKEESTKMFGNDYEKEFGTAAKAIARFGTPELRQFLNDTGIGNYPELVKFFNKVGKSVSEDNPVDGIKAGEPKSDAEVLYPKMGKGK